MIYDQDTSQTGKYDRQVQDKDQSFLRHIFYQRVRDEGSSYDQLYHDHVIHER